MLRVLNQITLLRRIWEKQGWKWLRKNPRFFRLDNAGQTLDTPDIWRPCQLSLQAGILSYPGYASHSPCPHWGHGENRRLCSRRSAAWLRQLCFGRRNDEKRRSSAARTERDGWCPRRLPGRRRVRQSTSSSTLLKHYQWLPIQQRIQFKIACITYKTIHTTQPAYLNSVLEH